MQYRRPVLKAGVPGKSRPSAKTSPRCPPQRAHRSSDPSTVISTGLTSSSSTPGSRAEKDGQPVPLSNLSVELKSSAPQATHLKVPERFSPKSVEDPGRSVPPWRKTKYSPGLRAAAHSRSGRCTSYPSVRLRSAPTGHGPVHTARPPRPRVATSRRRGAARHPEGGPRAAGAAAAHVVVATAAEAAARSNSRWPQHRRVRRPIGNGTLACKAREQSAAAATAISNKSGPQLHAAREPGPA
mmetsp:Transcript_3800/g.10536  ORF Transcript_3800/g.10536 Transcript_3800/m.10536 type:complete len:241 (-) Transcript_3800:7-729(-)